MIAQRVNHNVSVVDIGNVGEGETIVLTDMQSRRGGDTSTVRHSNQTGSTVSIFVEEESSDDNETNHAFEAVGVLAFEAGVLVANTEEGFSGLRPDSDMGNSEDDPPKISATFRGRLTALGNADSVGDREPPGRQDEGLESELPLDQSKLALSLRLLEANTELGDDSLRRLHILNEEMLDEAFEEFE